MKYFDRNTVKNNNKWQNREELTPSQSYWDKQEKEFKKGLKDFSYRIVTDKIWWNSLDIRDKRSAYRQYLSDVKEVIEYNTMKISNPIEINLWIPIEIEKLKLKFIPDVEVRRQIVLQEILK